MLGAVIKKKLATSTKALYCTVSSYEMSAVGKSIETDNRLGVAKVLGDCEKMGSDCSWTWSFFNWNVLKFIMVMVAQFCDSIRSSWNIYFRPGAVAQACNPSTLGARGRWITRSRDWDHPGQRGKTPSLLKIQKISWAWWHVPIIPATQEAEAAELPEPRRRRLRWAEIAPLHSSLGNKSETPSQKKKKKKRKCVAVASIGNEEVASCQVII